MIDGVVSIHTARMHGRPRGPHGIVMRKAKGIYLIPESAMLKPAFGPSEHIRAGVNELNRYFVIDQVVLKNGNLNPERLENSSQRKPKEAWGRRSRVIGLARDLKKLCVNHVNFFRYYREIKKRNADFIYERSEYLNFNGLLIAKLLKISHFYEVNWVHFLGMKQFYTSYFSPIARWLEEKAYGNSTHCFLTMCRFCWMKQRPPILLRD